MCYALLIKNTLICNSKTFTLSGSLNFNLMGNKIFNGSCRNKRTKSSKHFNLCSFKIDARQINTLISYLLNILIDVFRKKEL